MQTLDLLPDTVTFITHPTTEPPAAHEARDRRTVDLLLRLKQQDRGAYGELYALYHRGVHAYARQLLRCEHAADDIVQEVFERIWRYAPSFNVDKAQHPKAWIFQIARNQAMNELNRRSRLDELIDDDASSAMPRRSPLWEPADRDTLADSALLDDAALPAAHAQLPFVYRQVVFLRYHHELSLSEIAEHLGIPIGTAKTWLRRALIALRELMGAPAASASAFH